jgi:deoxyadenosine/deoxycytidine kinase
MGRKGEILMRLAVGGMIASGKSTLASQLSYHYHLPLIEEFTKDDEVFPMLLKWLYEGKPNVEMLLQIYFIHNQWLKHKEMGEVYIVDRDVIEHWIFAQVNLRKHPEVLNMYNGLYHAYMNSIKLPDLYVILGVNFDNFKKRIMERGRKEEIENFEKNETYFKDLLANYAELLRAQCVIYNIPYIIINTNGKTTKEITEEVIRRIDNVKNTRG